MPLDKPVTEERCVKLCRREGAFCCGWYGGSCLGANKLAARLRAEAEEKEYLRRYSTEPTPQPTMAPVRRRRTTASHVDGEAEVDWSEDAKCVEWTQDEKQLIKE